MYRIQANVQNLLIEVDETLAKHGFITFVRVDAKSPEDAEEKSMLILRGDSEIRSLLKNAPNDPPFIDILEIFELEPEEEAIPSPDGRLWYEMNPKKWWQFWR